MALIYISYYHMSSQWNMWIPVINRPNSLTGIIRRKNKNRRIVSLQVHQPRLFSMISSFNDRPIDIYF